MEGQDMAMFAGQFPPHLASLYQSPQDAANMAHAVPFEMETGGHGIMKRQGWTPEEDERLKELVKHHGEKNWTIIARELLGREPKQCRERWINHLVPGIVKGRLTDEEWQRVVSLQQEFGNRWSEIARFLPGRTPNQIKNYWHSQRRSRDIGKETQAPSPHSGKVNRTPRRKRSLDEISASPGSEGQAFVSNKKMKLDPNLPEEYSQAFPPMPPLPGFPLGQSDLIASAAFPFMPALPNLSMYPLAEAYDAPSADGQQLPTYQSSLANPQSALSASNVAFFAQPSNQSYSQALQMQQFMAQDMQQFMQQQLRSQLQEQGESSMEGAVPYPQEEQQGTVEEQENYHQGGEGAIVRDKVAADFQDATDSSVPQ